MIPRPYRLPLYQYPCETNPMPRPWHAVPMCSLTIALFLLATPALADVAAPVPFPDYGLIASIAVQSLTDPSPA